MSMNHRDTLTNTLQKAREKSGHTQEEIAQAVGVTRQTIIAIEKGNHSPSVLLALKLARFFNVPVEKIFTLE